MTARARFGRVLPYLVWIGTGLAWATAFVVVRAGVAELPPFTFAAGRTLIGAVVLLALAWRFHGDRRPTGPGLRFWIFMGIPQIAIPYAALFWAAQFLPAGLTATLFALFPTCTAVAAHFMVPDERLTPLKITGTLLAVVAVGLLVNPFTGGQAYPVAPVLAVLVGVVFASFGAVVVRGHGRTTSTLWLTALQTGSAGLALLVMALVFERGQPVPLTPFTVGAVAYLALVITVGCYIGLFWLLKRLDTTFVAMGTILETALAVVLGAAFLGEVVGSRGIGGFMLVAVSVGLVSFRHARPALQKRDARRP